MGQTQNKSEIDTLCLDGRKRLTMTGVDAVEGFSEQALKLTVNGKKVIVGGMGIKITAYNKSTGNLTADGEFLEVKYLGKKPPLVKRLFK